MAPASVTSLIHRRKMVKHAAEMKLAYQFWNEARVPEMLPLLDRNRPGPGEEDLRSFVWYYLRRLREGSRFCLRGHFGLIFPFLCPLLFTLGCSKYPHNVFQKRLAQKPLPRRAMFKARVLQILITATRLKQREHTSPVPSRAKESQRNFRPTDRKHSGRGTWMETKTSTSLIPTVRTQRIRPTNIIAGHGRSLFAPLRQGAVAGNER